MRAVYFHYMNRFFASGRLVVDMGAIQLVNAEHQRDFLKAAISLREIAKAYGIDSEQYKSARENEKQALSDFAHYRG